ncbi:unnamed protein product [Camellia sinensis]
MVAGRIGGLNLTGRKMKTWLGSGTLLLVNGMEMLRIKEATPKTIMRTMGVKGLALYHLKSHLQKCRLGKQSCKELPDSSKDASCIAESQDTGSCTTSSSKLAQDLNDRGNDASHSAEATTRRGSSSFARPDVVLCCVVNEC